jgi:hypothetical protein
VHGICIVSPCAHDMFPYLLRTYPVHIDIIDLSEILSFYCSFIIRNLMLKFYTQMEYDGNNMYECFHIFINFISSYAQAMFPYLLGTYPIHMDTINLSEILSFLLLIRY